MNFSHNSIANLPNRYCIGMALLAAVSLGFYLFASYKTFRLGFPLDDAWIHQTYARNLASYGEWSFIPGEASAGSTSPLWSTILAVGYFAHFNPLAWSNFLGWCLLLVLCLVGIAYWRALASERPYYAFWVGIFLVFEWHLVWAAGSGMETLLFSSCILIVLWLLAKQWATKTERVHLNALSWSGIGLLIGVSVWIRPDGITLLGPAVFTILTLPLLWKKRLVFFGLITLGFLAPFIIYILFNHQVSGSGWPNTFYAKQAEYLIYSQIPFWRRILNQALLPLVGGGILLLPGFIYYLFKCVREGQLWKLSGAIWFVGFLTLYAWRLPVTYQHGRYFMPAMPVYFVISLAGMAAWLNQYHYTLWQRILGKVWFASTFVLLVAFWFLGARTYGQDVAVIESEMVETARWVGENTEPNALLAAHDIGALGYFSGRNILDLAGLITPDVIGFIRNEDALKSYLTDQRADYLVTFPGWYSILVKNFCLIHQTGGKFSPPLGGENMAVFTWCGP